MKNSFSPFKIERTSFKMHTIKNIKVMNRLWFAYQL